jgi:hypothetical protein
MRELARVKKMRMKRMMKMRVKVLPAAAVMKTAAAAAVAVVMMMTWRWIDAAHACCFVQGMGGCGVLQHVEQWQVTGSWSYAQQEGIIKHFCTACTAYVDSSQCTAI